MPLISAIARQIKLSPQTTAFLYGFVGGTVNAAILTYMVNDLKRTRGMTQSMTQSMPQANQKIAAISK